MEPGMTELDVAAELEHEARLAGAAGMSFTSIVATGERSSMPHGHASAARLPRNGFITLDFGVILDGYCSDMTRTVYMGRATNEERAAYEAVLASQMAGVEAVKAGVACAEVDEACRSVLRRAGLAKWFTHGTGHGVGLEIHEGPRLGTGQAQKLEAGMVVTIEPGVYLTRKKGRNFGIRIEDMVLVKENGGEVLTQDAPKGWIEI
jgi:Xaa-Pro aminopeptidase